jgi:hypothetical protein
MLRKTVLALAAIAAVGTAALAPTAASAHGMRFFRPAFGWGYGYGPSYSPSNCYVVKQFTPFGMRVTKACSYY